MDASFWDDKFGQADLLYGDRPNRFFKSELERLMPGKLLLPGEGEGRNAVWAAKKKWEVHAIDYSSTGRSKALQWAAQTNTPLRYDLTDLTQPNCLSHLPNDFTAVGIFYLHLPMPQLTELMAQITDKVIPGGVLIAEWFAKGQLSRESGGPKDHNILLSTEDVQRLPGQHWRLRLATSTSTFLKEGTGHHGMADVVRLVATKL